MIRILTLPASIRNPFRKRFHTVCMKNAAAILGQKSRGFERYQNARVAASSEAARPSAGQEKPRRGEGHQHNPLIRHRRPRLRQHWRVVLCLNQHVQHLEGGGTGRADSDEQRDGEDETAHG
jgi:hypothetical protein